MVFLFGDLNYRIAGTNDLVRPAVKNSDYRYLKANDELMQAFELHRHSKECNSDFIETLLKGILIFHQPINLIRSQITMTVARSKEYQLGVIVFYGRETLKYNSKC